jgi:predicted flap endonuclease-1-like 5' DNA nuclease
MHLVCTDVGACGMRLGCLLRKLTALDRFVAASYGIQHQVNRHVEEAIVTSRREERTRLATDMPAKDLPLATDATLTGGLCLVAADPTSHAIVLEQAAQGRDHDTWHTLMEQALAGLNCQVMPSTSEEAPGLLASVEHHLGAHHSPDVCQVQHELVKAVSGPMATTQRTAAKAVSEAQARLEQAQEHRAPTGDEPNAQAPKSSPKAPLRLEQAQHEAQAARQALERISVQREQVAQRLRGIGQASHGVDGERGVRRNGQRIAAASQRHIDTMRGVAQHETLSQRCFDRIDTAPRVVPTMQATIDVVSGYVRHQVRKLDLVPSVADALHAHLMPACSLERVAQTRTVRAGEPLRELAERLRPPLCAPGGRFAALHPTEPTPADATGPRAGRGGPALPFQWRRAKRFPLPQEPSTSRARSPPKAGRSDRRAQLFADAARRHHRSGAVCRPETARDVCRDVGRG